MAPQIVDNIDFGIAQAKVPQTLSFKKVVFYTLVLVVVALVILVAFILRWKYKLHQNIMSELDNESLDTIFW